MESMAGKKLGELQADGTPWLRNRNAFNGMDLLLRMYTKRTILLQIDESLNDFGKRSKGGGFGQKYPTKLKQKIP